MLNLQELSIVIKHSSGFKLNHVFSHALHNALIGGGKHSCFGLVCDTVDQSHVSVNDLDRYALESWQSVLYSLVGTSGSHFKRPKVSAWKDVFDLSEW